MASSGGGASSSQRRADDTASAAGRAVLIPVPVRAAVGTPSRHERSLLGSLSTWNWVAAAVDVVALVVVRVLAAKAPVADRALTTYTLLPAAGDGASVQAPTNPFNFPEVAAPASAVGDDPLTLLSVVWGVSAASHVAAATDVGGWYTHTSESPASRGWNPVRAVESIVSMSVFARLSALYAGVRESSALVLLMAAVGAAMACRAGAEFAARQNQWAAYAALPRDIRRRTPPPAGDKEVAWGATGLSWLLLLVAYGVMVATYVRNLRVAHASRVLLSTGTYVRIPSASVTATLITTLAAVGVLGAVQVASLTSVSAASQAAASLQATPPTDAGPGALRHVVSGEDGTSVPSFVTSEHRAMVYGALTKLAVTTSTLLGLYLK